MRIRRSSFPVVLPALLAAFLAVPSYAGPARLLNQQIDRVLKNLPADGKATLRDLSLGRESLDTIELEPMEVWAKDAKITAFGADGRETIIPHPDVKYYKGRVVGEAESAVFFSRSADGSLRGMVLIGDRRWTIGSGVRKGQRPGVDVRKDIDNRNVDNGDVPILISEVDELDDLNDQSASWECEVGGTSTNDLRHRIASLSEEMAKKPVAEGGIVAGASYQLRIAIETDTEFCGAFGNNPTTIAAYLGDLIGKASTVYSRDLSTTLVLGDTHLRTGGPGSDPWTATNSSGALIEFGTYWHSNYSLGYPDPDGGGAGTAGGGVAVTRSSAVFLSGKLLSAGIAWVDVLCGDDFFCGTTGASCGSAAYANAYAGAYAFNSSSSSITTTVPDPEATVNGVQYGLPSGSSFWMLLEFMHEFGHNVASPHSSCIALTAPEKITYGVTRDYVDICLSGGTGCYSGSVSAPAEKGTIMSYCHNITVSGFRASRYLFGKAGEPSEKMLPIFKLGQDLDSNSPTGLEGCTANATITVQTEPVSCSAGRTASVPSCSGCTYAWQITGGSITSSTTTSSITYTPSQSSVTLTVTVLSARGCGITASKTFLASCVAVLAPTNVVATATSTSNVQVTWTAAVGATSYNVYRSDNALTFSLAGNTGATTFNDAGRSANTAYLYKVRAVNGGESGDSNKDLATTVVFTDEPLAAGSTSVKALHVTQLRTAVDAVRTLASLAGGSYTDPTLTTAVTQVKAAHINDLRSSLDGARTMLALSTISYAETINASTAAIKTSHINEVRNGVQ